MIDGALHGLPELGIYFLGLLMFNVDKRTKPILQSFFVSHQGVEDWNADETI